jgi:serine/threonine-protein kinase
MERAPAAQAGRKRSVLGSLVAGFRGAWLAVLLLGLGIGAVALGLVHLGGREGVAERGGAAVAPSIAVLPFTDLSPLKDQEYLADGLAEEILNSLAQVEGLKVAGRTSSFSFKGRGEELRVVGQKLHVAAILEGSVRKSGSKVRIVAQIVKSEDGFRLWSRTFDGDVTDVFAMEDAIARAVVEALQISLLPGHSPSIRGRQTSSPEAFEQYLRGAQLLGRYRLRETQQAQAHLEQAISLDPGYGLAWSALAEALALLSDWAEGEERPGLQQRALAAADQGVELAPDLADGWARRAILRMQIRWDWAGAESDVDRALKLNPRDVTANEARARLLAARGKLSEAIAAGRTVVELDPLHLGGWLRLHTFYVASGQPDLALGALEQAAAVAPTSYQVLDLFAAVDLAAGRPAAALAITQQPEVPEDSQFAFAALAHHALGQAMASQEALEKLVGGYAETEAYQIAEVHAGRGDGERALEWLDRAYRQRDGGLVAVLPWVSPVKWNPAFRKLHGEPRFRALLEKMNLPAN